MASQSPQELGLIIAKRLRALRLQKEWTREMLATQANVNVYSLKRFERSGQISFERLLALCEALGVLSEFDSILKPRARVSIEKWTVPSQMIRKRGKRRDTNSSISVTEN